MTIDFISKSHQFIARAPLEEIEEDRRFEEAMAYVQKNGWEIAAFIQNFDLIEELRFKLALACAEKNGWKTAQYIDLFNLTEMHRCEAAITSARQSGHATAAHIQKFDLTQELRFKVAMACAQQNGQVTAEHIQKFDLTEEQRFEAAALCARRSRGKMGEYIQEFALIEKHLFEVAILCARESGEALAEHIQKFGLTDQEQRFKVAKACAQQDGESTAYYIQNFCLTEMQHSEILTLSVLQNPSSLRYASDDFSLLKKILNDLDYCSHPSKIIETLSAPQEWRLDISHLILVLQNIENPEQQKEVIALAASALFVWTKTQQLEWASTNRFLHEILTLRAPYLRSKLIRLVAQTSTHFDQLPSKLPPLLKLPLAKLLAQGVDLSSLNLTEHALRDSAVFIPFLESMIELADNEDLDFEQKTNVLRAMSQKPIQSARDLLIILNFQRSNLLQTSLEAGLSALARESFRSAMPMAIDDCSTRFQTTFGSYRESTALEIYAANLYKNTMYHPALGALDKHAHSVLNGTYIEDRYNPKDNPHLQFLEDHRPGILRAWQRNSEPEPLLAADETKIAPSKQESRLAALTIIETDDPQDILVCGTEIRASCQKVNGDPSLNRGLVGYLRNGQTRMIAVKDKTGRLVARCMLRLLVDKEEKPVLFLERLYSNLDNPRIYPAIVEKAKQTANRLLCPLTSLQGETLYGSPLQSLGGKAPWEYVDGTLGIQKGPYTIYSAKLLYNPNSEVTS